MNKPMSEVDVLRSELQGARTTIRVLRKALERANDKKELHGPEDLVGGEWIPGLVVVDVKLNDRQPVVQAVVECAGPILHWEQRHNPRAYTTEAVLTVGGVGLGGETTLVLRNVFCKNSHTPSRLVMMKESDYVSSNSARIIPGIGPAYDPPF